MQIKAIAALVAVLALIGLLLGGGAYAYRSGYKAGVASIQVKDGQQQVQAATQARAHDQAQAGAFVGIDASFQQDFAHAHSTSDPAVPALLAGTISLQPVWQCPSIQPSTGVSKAAAASIGRDAAATQALADRVQSAARVIGYADDGDARERQLDAQVIALQRLLQAERASQP